MRKLEIKYTQNLHGGGLVSSFCSGISGARFGIAAFNAAVSAGIITGVSALATGGVGVLIIVGLCAAYGIYNNS